MREIVTNLDTFYVTNYVLVMMKWNYCHMYHGNSQGSGKLNKYNITNNPVILVVPKGKGNTVSKQYGYKGTYYPPESREIES